MIKVIVKALDILEYISREPDKPLPLSLVAGSLGLNQPTCARILKMLVARHYIDQPLPRGGYILGPMAYYLASRGTYRKELTRAAAAVAAQCARATGEYVTVASYFRGRRYILANANGNPELQIRPELDYFLDVYATATGRLLLAFEPPEEQEAFIRKNGLPQQAWHGIGSRAALNRELARIRTDRFHIDLEREQTVVFAYPVCEGDRVAASLGVALLKSRFKGSHKQTVLSAARRSADEISAAISRNL